MASAPYLGKQGKVDLDDGDPLDTAVLLEDLGHPDLSSEQCSHQIN